MSKLNILILVRRFDKLYPKHKVKYEFLQAIERVANVAYHHEDGDILEIVKRQKHRPDFIFHYDITARNILSPKINNLDKIDIPVGAYVIDAHWDNALRKKYFKENKISLIFSVSKAPFLKRFPEYKSKFRFLPFSINPKLIRNWNLKKDIDFLLMGLIAKSYPFRAAVRDKMKNEKGFVYHKHPGHLKKDRSKYIIDEAFGKEVNRAKIFFTCGSIYQYPVMKYFEVPGCNTLLIAEKTPDLIELGFKDGVNYVAANQANFYEKGLYYLKNEKKRKEIALEGYKFVHKNHTHLIRAQQFVRYVENFIIK
ncbi:MAG TPA: glycosyltransferase [Candidatus Avamphibacillus sp.]|nr:glycosyltransferase [Candidatus Avamphibacillus sp.]